MLGNEIGQIKSFSGLEILRLLKTLVFEEEGCKMCCSVSFLNDFGSFLEKLKLYAE